jgi:hypothetical protein
MMIGPSCFTFTSYLEALGFGIQVLPHRLYFDRFLVVIPADCELPRVGRAVRKCLFIYCWEVMVNNSRQFACERDLI